MYNIHIQKNNFHKALILPALISVCINMTCRSVSAENYANDNEFQKLVMEMLETKSSAVSKKDLCQGALKQLRTGGMC
jgi:hypothetical protein